jgi:hypothetical protein
MGKSIARPAAARRRTGDDVYQKLERNGHVHFAMDSFCFQVYARLGVGAELGGVKLAGAANSKSRINP